MSKYPYCGSAKPTTINYAAMVEFITIYDRSLVSWYLLIRLNLPCNPLGMPKRILSFGVSLVFFLDYQCQGSYRRLISSCTERSDRDGPWSPSILLDFVTNPNNHLNRSLLLAFHLSEYPFSLSRILSLMFCTCLPFLIAISFLLRSYWLLSIDFS